MTTPHECDAGWIAVPDPVLGGLIDNRCPDCGPSVTGPRQKRKTVPKAWAGQAAAWFAHVATCPHCSQFYEPEDNL